MFINRTFFAAASTDGLFVAFLANSVETVIVGCFLWTCQISHFAEISFIGVK